MRICLFVMMLALGLTSNEHLENFMSEAAAVFGYPASFKLCSTEEVADKAIQLLNEALGLIGNE